MHKKSILIAGLLAPTFVMAASQQGNIIDEIIVTGTETPGSARRYGLTITLRPAVDHAPQTLALDAAARSTNIV